MAMCGPVHSNTPPYVWHQLSLYVPVAMYDLVNPYVSLYILTQPMNCMPQMSLWPCMILYALKYACHCSPVHSNMHLRSCTTLYIAIYSLYHPESSSESSCDFEGITKCIFPFTMAVCEKIIWKHELLFILGRGNLGLFEVDLEIP